MFYKRTLILNDLSSSQSSKKGVITLESSADKIKGNLKLYNFSTLPQDVALGINVGDEVIKVPLSLSSNAVEFDIPKNLNLQEKLSCGLVDISQISSPRIIVGGTSNYLNDWADVVEQAFNSEVKPLEREEMYESSEEEIDCEITSVLRDDKEYKDCSMCSNCKYKQAFFENSENSEVICQNVEDKKTSENIEKINELLKDATLDVASTENQDKNNSGISTTSPSDNSLIESGLEKPKQEESSEEMDFYSQIKDQIDDLFKHHSRQEGLEILIPNSKWVKVEYEDTEGHYVIGLIYDEGKLQFISYGLPAQNSSSPPKDLVDYAQWLPLDSDQNAEGYWLVYQSAQSGESIKIN